MMLKGGWDYLVSISVFIALTNLMIFSDDVWGDSNSAPDDLPNATLSGGNIFYFRSESHMNTSDVTAEHTTPNLTLNDAVTCSPPSPSVPSNKVPC